MVSVSLVLSTCFFSASNNSQLLNPGGVTFGKQCAFPCLFLFQVISYEIEHSVYSIKNRSRPARHHANGLVC